jgi:hypothetical protein
MSRQADQFIELAGEMIRTVSTRADRRARRLRRRRRRRRAFLRFLKISGLMALAALLILGGMASVGLFLGESATEGLIAGPLAVLIAWAVILFFARGGGQRFTPKALAQSDLPQLPARTEEWLELQRRSLPSGAQRELDSINARLEALRPQLRALPAQTPAAHEVRRLLGEELPELIHGYQKVPPSMQRQPLHGGPSPDSRLTEGLATISEEIHRMHERLAADDLNALATQQRYLEMKYKRDDELE